MIVPTISSAQATANSLIRSPAPLPHAFVSLDLPDKSVISLLNVVIVVTMVSATLAYVSARMDGPTNSELPRSALFPLKNVVLIVSVIIPQVSF